MKNAESVLRVNDLTKIFQSRRFFSSQHSTVQAVNNVSLELAPGEIIGLLGPNGSGKTTTINMLIGTLLPTRGSIYYFGENFLNNRSAVLQKIAFASSSVQLPTVLSVYQNLDIHGRLYGISSQERMKRIHDLLEIFGIWHLKNTQTGYLSSGQATRLMMAKAFLSKPSIVLLDEATAALDPDIAQGVRKFLLDQRNHYGTSIILASHNMTEVAYLCDRILVLQQGSIIANDKPDQLLQTMAKVRINFKTGHLERMRQFFHTQNIAYSIVNQTIEIELTEPSIANLLQNFACENISYDHVSIEKPTLEDYFLKITRQPNTLIPVKGVI